jgi:hypothetical protein
MLSLKSRNAEGCGCVRQLHGARFRGRYPFGVAQAVAVIGNGTKIDPFSQGGMFKKVLTQEKCLPFKTIDILYPK